MGVASKLETDRAAAALANAAAAIPQLEIQVATAENQLNVLLGRNPGPVVRNALTNQPPSSHRRFPPVCRVNFCAADRTCFSPSNP